MATGTVRLQQAERGTLAGWRGLTAFGCLLAIGIVAAVNVAAGSPVPPLIGFGVLFAVAVALLWVRAGRSGAVLALLAAGVFLAPGVPTAAEAFAWANDPLEFTVRAASLVALAVVALGGLVVVVRGRDTLTAASAAPRGLIVLSMFVILAALLSSLALRLAVQDAVALPGDVVVGVHRATFPATITADAGEFAVVVDNDDAGAHTFTVDELGVDVIAPGRARTKATITATAGEYSVRCRIPGKEAMRATLLVR